MKSLKHTLLLLSVLSVSLVSAQVNFEAKVSKETVGLNESIQVDFEMNKDGNDFTAPSFNDFEVVSGPNKSINNTWISGEHTYKKVITYHITPKKQGDLVIGEASMNINDETYLTKPLTVQVDEKYKSNEENSYVLKFNDNVHLVAELSSNTLSEGHTTQITYKLYVSPDVGISSWKVVEKPEYKGFYSSDVNMKKTEVHNGTYKSKPYRYVILSLTKLTSKEKGKFQFKPLKLNVTVEIPTDKKDVFGGRVMKTVNKTLESDQVIVTVK